MEKSTTRVVRTFSNPHGEIAVGEMTRVVSAGRRQKKKKKKKESESINFFFLIFTQADPEEFRPSKPEI